MYTENFKDNEDNTIDIHYSLEKVSTVPELSFISFLIENRLFRALARRIQQAHCDPN